MMKSEALRRVCLSLAIFVSCVVAVPGRATVIAIDYTTGFTSPIQVITSDQPYGAISGDPGSGVTFVNPNFFHNTTLGALENFNIFTSGFGGAVAVVLPGESDRFGLFAGANSEGTAQFTLEFFDGAASVGLTSFTLPSGQPSTPIAAAFLSDVLFDSVLLTAPAGGFMRINQDSIRFELAVQQVPLPGTLLLAATGLVVLALSRRRGTGRAAPVTSR